MSTFLFLILLLMSAGIALIIGCVIQAFNGDDGSVWSHDALSDEEHHWE